MTEQEFRTKLLDFIESEEVSTLSNLAVYSVLTGVTHIIEVMVDMELSKSLLKQGGGK